MVGAILIDFALSIILYFSLLRVLKNSSVALRSCVMIAAYLVTPVFLFSLARENNVDELYAMAISICFSSTVLITLCFSLCTHEELAIRGTKSKWVLIAFVLAVVFTVMVSVYAYWIDIPEQQLLNASKNNFGPATFIIWVFAVLVAPLIEELLFRGCLFKAFLRDHGPQKSILLSGLFFGFVHLEVPESIPMLVLLGWMLGWLRVASQSIWPPLVLHAANNSIVIILMLLG